ncbi:MAG: hypothetical protein Kow00108_13230 [Calditrichia bacterium]
MPIDILLIDDEEDKRRIFKLKIESLNEDYKVSLASGGEEGLKMLQDKEYHLVLLDLSMPGMDGYEVLKQIKNNFKTRNIPVIILTASTATADEIQSIDIGADDFLTKEASKEIMQVRIKSTLRKHRLMMGLNPLTHLPGNIQIEEAIQSRIEQGIQYAVGYVDLDHFKEYNDTFGFNQGDLAIKMTAEILKHALNTKGNEDDFLGHVGGDDFIFITLPQVVMSVCDMIKQLAELNFPKLYPKEIREKGFYLAKNRKGKEEKIPLLSLSIAVVTNENIKFQSIAEISSRASEVKKKAKSIEGNSIYMDRRRN